MKIKIKYSPVRILIRKYQTSFGQFRIIGGNEDNNIIANVKNNNIAKYSNLLTHDIADFQSFCNKNKNRRVVYNPLYYNLLPHINLPLYSSVATIAYNYPNMYSISALMFMPSLSIFLTFNKPNRYLYKLDNIQELIASLQITGDLKPKYQDPPNGC